MEVLGCNDKSQLNFRYSERNVVKCIKKESAYNRRETASECSSDSFMKKYVEVTEVVYFLHKPYSTYHMHYIEYITIYTEYIYIYIYEHIYIICNIYIYNILNIYIYIIYIYMYIYIFLLLSSLLLFQIKNL